MPGPADDADSEQHDAERWVERRDHGDEEEQRRERERHVREPHDELVDPPAVIAGEQPERDAER